jgi:hypothetical protein
VIHALHDFVSAPEPTEIGPFGGVYALANAIRHKTPVLILIIFLKINY